MARILRHRDLRPHARSRYLFFTAVALFVGMAGFGFVLGSQLAGAQFSASIARVASVDSVATLELQARDLLAAARNLQTLANDPLAADRRAVSAANFDAGLAAFRADLESARAAGGDAVRLAAAESFADQAESLARSARAKSVQVDAVPGTAADRCEVLRSGITQNLAGQEKLGDMLIRINSELLRVQAEQESQQIEDFTADFQQLVDTELLAGLRPQDLKDLETRLASAVSTYEASEKRLADCIQSAAVVGACDELATRWLDDMLALHGILAEYQTLDIAADDRLKQIDTWLAELRAAAPAELELISPAQ